MSLSTNLPGPGYVLRGEVMPAVVCLDCSESMLQYDKMGSMNKALQRFIEAIRKHDRASEVLEWEFITFQTDASGTPRINELIGAFQRPQEQIDLGDLKAEGKTPLAEAVDLALRKLAAQKKDYMDTKQPYLQPWLVVMTDGIATSPPELIEKVLQDVNNLVTQNKLTVIAVGIGLDADRNFLARLSPKRAPDLISDEAINTYFTKLSDSFILASQGVVDAPALAAS